MFMIYDCIQGFNIHIHITCLWWSTFLIGRWFAKLCARQNGYLDPGESTQCWLGSQMWKNTTMDKVLERQAESVLHLGAPYPNEDSVFSTEDWFKVTYNVATIEQFQVEDHFWRITTPLP